MGRAPAEHPLFLTFPHKEGRNPYCWGAELEAHLGRTGLRQPVAFHPVAQDVAANAE